MIGPRLREARLARHLSLNAVAEKAGISVATLSRVERDQQRIDVELLLTLMRILELDAHDVLGEEAKEQERGVDPVAAKITALAPEDRTKLWRTLASSRKAQRTNAPGRAVAQQVDEFLAQIDFLRAEIESVRRKLR